MTGPLVSRIAVTAAGAALLLSTLTPSWVTSVRTMGGHGSLNVYGSASAWAGHFAPWLWLAALAMAGALVVALTGLAGGRARPSRRESGLQLLLGGTAALAMAVALWQGPSGSRPEGFGFLVFRSGTLAYGALPLTFVPLLAGLAGLIGGRRRVIVAAASALVVAAAVLVARPVPVQLNLVAGPIPDWRTTPEEPYPFTTPIPPQVATPLDGAYDRDPTENYPGLRPGCVRCQPFPLDAGRSVLTLDRGRYLLAQAQPRYRDAGHYVVTGSHITFYNSPECGSVRGVYRWRLDDGTLTLSELFDLCGFGQRARDLTDRPWTLLPPGTATPGVSRTFDVARPFRLP